MNSHELARLLLEHEDGPVSCSVDISTGEDDAGRRVFGEFIEVGHTPSRIGFSTSDVMLLFVGSLNYEEKQ